jgi:hypothetical protein
MIAHRLQTIQTAENLLYFESPTSLIHAEKGTSKYSEILQKLKSETYKHQEQIDNQFSSLRKLQDEAERLEEEIDEMREGKFKEEDVDIKGKPILKPIDGGDPKQHELDRAEVYKASHPTAKELTEVYHHEDILLDSDEQSPVKSETGFGRVMSYYSPKGLAALQIVVAIVNSAAMPAFGWCLSELIFVIMKGVDDPKFKEDRDRWSTYFALLAVGMGLVGFLKKWLFAVTGENLTFDVRCLLFKSLMHK